MRRLFHCCVLFALLTLALPLAAAAHQDGDGQAALDLGAMMPTPAEIEDAGLPGYAIWNGWTDTLDDELIGYLAGDFSEAEVEEMLDGLGYQRSLVTTFDLPSEDEPELAAGRVMVYIDEYDQDDDLFDVFDLFLAYPDNEPVEGEETIGDDSMIVRYTETTPDTGAEVSWLVLGFTYENLTAQISIGDFKEYLPDDEPTVAQIEALGRIVVERMASAIDGDAPGLANRVLRFESDGANVVYIEDFYARSGRTSLALYGDDAERTDEIDEAADDAGMRDVYFLEQWLGVDGQYAIDWNVNVRTFADDEAASDWLAGVPELAETTSDVDDFARLDDPALGDEAIAFTYRHPGASGEETFFWLDTLVRVDETVVTVSIGRLGDLPPDDLSAELIDAELACLDAGDCAAESAAPDDLLELAADDLGASGGNSSAESAVSDEELLARVETFDDLSQEHVEGPVDYEQVPPVGGAHNPVPQTCGFYAEPIGSEHAVHSLEHGAVWVTFDPALPTADVRALEALTEEHDFLLVSPFEGLPAPVVASAWGVQIQLDGVDDPYLLAFIDYFEQGPQNPEPGASCDGTMEAA